jgi:hypothetical protein
MTLSASFSKITTLFKARKRSPKIKWRSSSEKYWSSNKRSCHPIRQASGAQRQPSKLWNYSSKLLLVQQCLKKSEICLQVWLDSSTKTSASSDLVLMKWKQISSMLLNNSRIKKSFHWTRSWSQEKSKFKSSFQVLATSREKMRSSTILRSTKRTKMTLPPTTNLEKI